LNPRPQAFFAQFYMCSRLIWVSLPAARSGTLYKSPATFFLDPPQVARGEPSRMKLPHSLDSLRHPCPAYRLAVV